MCFFSTCLIAISSPLCFLLSAKFIFALLTEVCSFYIPTGLFIILEKIVWSSFIEWPWALSEFYFLILAIAFNAIIRGLVLILGFLISVILVNFATNFSILGGGGYLLILSLMSGSFNFGVSPLNIILILCLLAKGLGSSLFVECGDLASIVFLARVVFANWVAALTGLTDFLAAFDLSKLPKLVLVYFLWIKSFCASLEVSPQNLLCVWLNEVLSMLSKMCLSWLGVPIDWNPELFTNF